jgi:choline dehydrogenase-like flavoprotein
MLSGLGSAWIMTESARIVVIGSGPAGAAAALAASRIAGVETLVLEAGPASARLGFTVRVNGFTVAKRRPHLALRPDITHAGDPKTQIYEEIAPGGLSNHWSCAVPRFSQEDFDDGARSGEEYAWPIGYADVAPWYDYVEPLLHIAGGDTSTLQLPAGRIAALRRLGPDWNGVARAAAGFGRSVVPMPYAYGGSTFFTPSGTSFNAYTRLIAPAAKRGALTFRGDSRAVRLEWAPSERRVVAVVSADTAGRETRIPCRGVVVAAGAINSATLLLASSSSDFPHGLGNEHDVLGRYLHDHPLGKSVIDLALPVPVHRPSYITRPTLERSTPLLAAAYMQWAGTRTLATSILAGRPGRATEIGFTVFGSMVPRADDLVALDGGRSSDGRRPKLTLSLRHPEEVASMLEQARRELLSMFEQAGWGPRERVWVVEPPGTSVHYGGTCRMHALPRYGVVDGWSRVHGVANVAVADSAVFTTTPEKNPVLTAMALAARAGDRLAREIRDGAA